MKKMGSVLGLLVIFCAHSSFAQDWGGVSSKLSISSDPTSSERIDHMVGTLQFDCASGTIDEGISDGRGGFTADGTYTREVGPVHLGHPDIQKAHFLGYTHAEANQMQMTLILFLETSQDTPIIYQLVRGQAALLRTCK